MIATEMFSLWLAEIPWIDLRMSIQARFLFMGTETQPPNLPIAIHTIVLYQNQDSK